MSAQTGSLTVKELEATYGVLFIGYVIGMIIYGFTFFQTYVYYSRYPLDHWAIKTTVGSLCILDTLSSTLISHALYHYFVLSFPNTPPLLDITYTYCAEIGVSVLAVLVVQIYYSHRVWMASKNAAIAAGIAVVSLIAFVLGIVATANLAMNPVFTSLAIPQDKAIIASSQALTFVSGVAAFAVLSFYLSPSQNPIIKSTESLYNIVIGYTIARGSLATTVQLGYFVVFVSMPTKPFWMPFHLVASRMFINSLLAMLNSREIYQGHGLNEEDVVSRTTNASSSFSVPRFSSGVGFNVAESKPGINIQVTRTTDNDTTSKLFLRNEEGNDWHHKRAGTCDVEVKPTENVI